jgi:hypothetical protein
MYITLGSMGFGVVWCAASDVFIFASFVFFYNGVIEDSILLGCDVVTG